MKSEIHTQTNRQKKTYILLAGIILLALIAFGMYQAGYRVGEFGVGKVGTVTLSAPLLNTEIYVDSAEKILTSTDNEVVALTLAPTAHQVIVTRDGYLPWIKKFTLISGEKLTLAPLFVTQNATGEIITAYDKEHDTIQNKVAADTLPKATAPKISTDATAKVWVENNIIYVSDTSGTHIVIAPEPTVKNVAFYKNRSDAILFSAGNTIFTIETNPDPAHVQNIFPVFKGTDPTFIETGPNFMYVHDGTTLMQVVI